MNTHYLLRQDGWLDDDLSDSEVLNKDRVPDQENRDEEIEESGDNSDSDDEVEDSDDDRTLLLIDNLPIRIRFDDYSSTRKTKVKRNKTITPIRMSTVHTQGSTDKDDEVGKNDDDDEVGRKAMTDDDDDEVGKNDDSVTVGWSKLSNPEDIPTFPSISLLTHEDTLSTKQEDTLSTKREDTLSTERRDEFKRTGKYNQWNSQKKKTRSKNDRYSRGKKEYARKSVNPKVDYSKHRKDKN